MAEELALPETNGPPSRVVSLTFLQITIFPSFRVATCTTSDLPGCRKRSLAAGIVLI